MYLNIIFEILKKSVLTATFLCFIFSTNGIAEDKKQVLILHSYHQGLAWTDSITQGIKDTFSKSPVPVELQFEFMDTKRVFDPKHLANLKAMFRHKYAEGVFDVIISSDDHAFRFLLDNHHALFLETPVVFCGVNGFRPELIENNKMFTGVVEALSFKETIEAAYELQPDLERVYAVVDDTVTGHSNKKQLLDAISTLKQIPQLVFLEHRTMNEMQGDTAVLPEKSILIYLSFTTDSAGQHFSLEEGASLINQNANRPMFSFWDFHIGHGVAGGKMTHGITQGQTAAEMAIRVLGGEKAHEIPIVEKSPNQFIFDYTVLEKFNLEQGNLPAGTIIVNSPKSFLEQNKKLIIQFLLIIGGLIGIIVFISYHFLKLRIADKSLKISEERFREITELLPETIYEIDLDRNCTFLNKSGKDQFQVTDEDIQKGLSFYKLFAEHERETLDKRLDQIESGKTPGLWEYQGKRRNGDEFPVIARGMPISRESEVIGVRGIIIDISEKKRLEEQFNTVQRMESIGTLAGGIAHDFNNLLVGIQGSASLGLLQCEPESQLYSHLKRIDECSQSAANLTKQLLGLARSRNYDLKQTNINKLISKTVEMFGRTKKELQIKENLQEGVWAVHVDRSQIEQVLLNLLINAWHAIEGSGTITIETQNISLMKNDTTGIPSNSAPYVCIKVIDTGSGISPEIKDKIFDPFFTTKERGRGTGLGLASSFGIIKNHRGTIEVDSDQGNGTTFTICLPAQEIRAGEGPLQPGRIEKGTENLLVVDDEEMVRGTTADLLEQLGYTVHLAKSGSEALQMMEAMQDKIDLVLLDIIMPGMTGEETFRELKKINPNLRVLFCSGYSANQQISTLINEPGSNFIQKPFDLHTLSLKVREVLQPDPASRKGTEFISQA